MTPRTDVLNASLAFRPLLIVGDSHSHIYTFGGMTADRIVPVHLLCSGGSARGLDKDDSRSSYGSQIRSLLDGLLRCPVLFQFGQVDAEFVYNLKRVLQKGNAFDADDYRRFLTQSADRYTRFLATLKSRCEPFVCSIFPPTLNDEGVRSGYINGHIAYLNSIDEVEHVTQRMHELELPDQVQRTAFHAFFNAELARFCADRGLTFVNLFDRLLSGPMLNPIYAFIDAPDHHLALNAATHMLAATVLREIIDTYDAMAMR